MDDETIEIRKRLAAILGPLGTRSITSEVIDGKTVRSIRLELLSGQMRARLPFAFEGRVVPREKQADLGPEIAEMLAQREKGEGRLALRAKGDKAEEDSRVMISGTASSTSQDWYGTEMSLPCLDDMAAQFREGVDYTPKHGSWFVPLEWDDVMGQTIMASVVRANVAAPAVETDAQFKLEVTSDCDGLLEKVQSLIRRLDRKQKIGMSIGGWFRDIQYFFNDEDELERIVIHRVELDHLAVVRSPANPDCTDLKLIREVAAETIKARSKEPATPVVAVVAAPAGEPGTRAASPVVAAPVEPLATRSTDAPVEPPMVASASPAVTEEPAPVVNRGGITSPPGIDTSPAARNDGDVPAVSGGSAPPPSPAPAEDSSMNADELRAILDAALKPLATRIEGLEAARSAPATPAPVPVVAAPAAVEGDAALRARLAELEGQLKTRNTILSHLAEMPVRSGMGHVVTLNGDPVYTESTIEGLLGRAKAEDKAPVLTEVITRHKAALTIDMRAKGGEKGAAVRAACEGAPELLGKILNGAEMDGTLEEWRRSA